MTITTDVEQFFDSHEEADKSIFFHLNHDLPGSTVVMQTDDTNSLVIALGYIHLFNTLEIWLEAAVQGKNKLRSINGSNIYSEFGETLYKASPTLHALTGCNYTASFFKRSKVRGLNSY